MFYLDLRCGLAGFAREQMRKKSPDNAECEEGVMYYINAVRWCPYLGQGKEYSEDDRQAILSRRPPPKPAEEARDMYIPHALEAPERATRKGLVYTKGQGFGLPTGWSPFPAAIFLSLLPVLQAET